MEAVVEEASKKTASGATPVVREGEREGVMEAWAMKGREKKAARAAIVIRKKEYLLFIYQQALIGRTEGIHDDDRIDDLLQNCPLYR